MSPVFSRSGSKHPTWSPTARSAGARSSRSPWALSQATPRQTRSAKTTCLATKAIASPTPSRTPRATANTFQNSPSCCQASKHRSGSLPEPTTRWCPGPTPSSSVSDYPTPRSISLLARAISAGKKNPLNTPRCSPAGGTEPRRRRKANNQQENRESEHDDHGHPDRQGVGRNQENRHDPRPGRARRGRRLATAPARRRVPALRTTRSYRRRNNNDRRRPADVDQRGGDRRHPHGAALVAEVHEPHHCRMVSLSDVQTPAGWTKIQVIWDLSVTALDSASCRYTNQVLSYPTPAFLETLKVAGISFEDAVADRQAASDDHNRRETARYALSLERKALSRN